MRMQFETQENYTCPNEHCYLTEFNNGFILNQEIMRMKNNNKKEFEFGDTNVQFSHPVAVAN